MGVSQTYSVASSRYRAAIPFYIGRSNCLVPYIFLRPADGLKVTMKILSTNFLFPLIYSVISMFTTKTGAAVKTTAKAR